MFPQLGGGSGGNESNGEQQVKLCFSPAVCLVPDRLKTNTGPQPRGWGPLT